MPVLLLGPIEATDHAAAPVSIGRRTERVALAVLAVNAGTLVDADTLADAAWGGAPPWVRALEGAMLAHSPDLDSQPASPAHDHRRLSHAGRCRSYLPKVTPTA